MTKNVQAAGDQPAQQRVYSNDKKIYLGMTVRDASKSTETMKIFDFADIDKNGKIDKEELDRYNGPIVVQNIATKEARVFGTYKGYTGGGIFAGDIIKDNELVYYPGLTVEKIGDKGRVSFTQIDTNHDGKLSKEEVNAIAKELKQLDNTKQKMIHAYEKALKATRIGGSIAFGASAAFGVAGGVACMEVLAGVVFGGLAVIPAGGAFFGYIYYKNSQLQDELNGIKEQFLNNVKSPYVKERALEEFSKMRLKLI